MYKEQLKALLKDRKEMIEKIVNFRDAIDQARDMNHLKLLQQERDIYFNKAEEIEQRYNNFVQLQNDYDLEQRKINAEQNRINELHSQRVDLLNKEIELERLRRENNKASMQELDDFYNKL